MTLLKSCVCLTSPAYDINVLLPWPLFASYYRGALHKEGFVTSYWLLLDMNMRIEGPHKKSPKTHQIAPLLPETLSRPVEHRRQAFLVGSPLRQRPKYCSMSHAKHKRARHACFINIVGRQAAKKTSDVKIYDMNIRGGGEFLAMAVIEGSSDREIKEARIRERWYRGEKRHATFNQPHSEQRLIGEFPPCLQFRRLIKVTEVDARTHPSAMVFSLQWPDDKKTPPTGYTVTYRLRYLSIMAGGGDSCTEVSRCAHGLLPYRKVDIGGLAGSTQAPIMAFSCSMPSGSPSEFSHVGIVLDYAAGRRPIEKAIAFLIISYLVSFPHKHAIRLLFASCFARAGGGDMRTVLWCAVVATAAAGRGAPATFDEVRLDDWDTAEMVAAVEETAAEAEMGVRPAQLQWLDRRFARERAAAEDGGGTEAAPVWADSFYADGDEPLYGQLVAGGGGVGTASFLSPHTCKLTRGSGGRKGKRSSEKEPQYDYEQLRAEYEAAARESARNATTEAAVPEAGLGAAVGRIVDVRRPSNCSAEAGRNYGPRALLCLWQELRGARTSGQRLRLLGRLGHIVAFWLLVWTAIAVPFWCHKVRPHATLALVGLTAIIYFSFSSVRLVTSLSIHPSGKSACPRWLKLLNAQGWCCWCLHPCFAFCRPRTSLRKVRGYLAWNPPGKLQTADGRVIGYEPTIYEAELFHSMERQVWSSAGMQDLPASWIVRHVSHGRKSVSDPSGDRTRFASAGGEEARGAPGAAERCLVAATGNEFSLAHSGTFHTPLRYSRRLLNIPEPRFRV
ncbi:hypothetical protein PR048_006639 [Dryococelus australis]|uniref:Uncharacterized protein n=1 Tax=Dryococelus australis TaxID=614101 RepID=A0ABQ9IBH6_9NEOP|nr:hypothetical protein PR048_006639 [Dryococelus australis]